MDKAQREYYLRKQLKAIKKKLRETDETEGDAAEYAAKLEKADMPEEIRQTMTFEPVDQIDQALKVALAAEKARK